MKIVCYIIFLQVWTVWSPLWSEHKASVMSLLSPSHFEVMTSWAAHLTRYLRRSWSLIISLSVGQRSEVKEMKMQCVEDINSKGNHGTFYTFFQWARELKVWRQVNKMITHQKLQVYEEAKNNGFILFLYLSCTQSAHTAGGVATNWWNHGCRSAPNNSSDYIHTSQCGSSLLPKDTTTELGMLTLLPWMKQHLTDGDMIFGKKQYLYDLLDMRTIKDSKFSCLFCFKSIIWLFIKLHFTILGNTRETKFSHVTDLKANMRVTFDLRAESMFYSAEWWFTLCLKSVIEHISLTHT